MADNRTMAELLQAPTGGFEDAIVIPSFQADNFELKPSLITLVQSNKFYGDGDKTDPHGHIRYFEKITNNFRFQNVPSTTVKLLLFPFLIDGVAKTWLDKEPPQSILTWDDLDLLRACPHHGFSLTHQIDTFYNALNYNEQDSLNSAAGGYFLDKMPNDCLRIIESKAKVRHSRNAVLRVSTNAPPSSSSPSNSFKLQQIATTLEDKMEVRMSRLEKSINEMKVY
ncbi:hypothetical protein Tco_1172938 [Tanacetum coccineum]